MVDAGARAEKSPALIQRAAEGGDVSAQHELGMMYEHGLGMPKDQQAAIFWYTSAAQSGSEHAQYKLAGMYESGHVVGQDYAIALKWLRKAAEAGLAEAQYKIGFYLEQGRGTQQKYSEAAAWYISAASQGMPDAQFRLGLLYETGKGVPRDPESAVRYYTEAASKGNANAQYNLGVLYVTGEGVPKDLNLATQYFEAAAAHGHNRAKSKYEETRELTFNRPKAAEPETDLEKARRHAEERKEGTIWKAVWSVFLKALIPLVPMSLFIAVIKFTPFGQFLADISVQNRPIIMVAGAVCTIATLVMVTSFFKAKTKPKWFQIVSAALVGAAALGIAVVLMGPEAQIAEDSKAQKAIKTSGTASGAGSGVVTDGKNPTAKKKPPGPSDVEKVNSLLLIKAKKGDPVAQTNLAVRYETGLGLDQNMQIAAQWYAAAAKLNNRFAQCRLAMMYKNGTGVKTDYAQAVKLLQKAAADNFAPADYQLGLMYEYGQGVGRNFNTAATWYQKGEKLREPHNKYRLGLLVFEGKGIAQDVKRGIRLIREAAEQDLPQAASRMADFYRQGVGVTQSETVAARWDIVSQHAKPVLAGTDDWLYEQADLTTQAPTTSKKYKSGGQP